MAPHVDDECTAKRRRARHTAGHGVQQHRPRPDHRKNRRAGCRGSIGAWGPTTCGSSPSTDSRETGGRRHGQCRRESWAWAASQPLRREEMCRPPPSVRRRPGNVTWKLAMEALHSDEVGRRRGGALQQRSGRVRMGRIEFKKKNRTTSVNVGCGGSLRAPCLGVCPGRPECLTVSSYRQSLAVCSGQPRGELR